MNKTAFAQAVCHEQERARFTHELSLLKRHILNSISISMPAYWAILGKIKPMPHALSPLDCTVGIADLGVAAQE